MTYTVKPPQTSDNHSSAPLFNPATMLAQVMAQLPPNNLAVFGHRPVRSQPYPRWPVFDERDIQAVTDVVTSGRWGGAPFPGPHTAAFAKAFVAMQAGPNSSVQAVPMMNGSVTMEVALRAAQIGWGDEVIVPAYTFQATAAAPIAAGAMPVIVDIDPDTYCISPAAIEVAITDKTRAIIPVHLGAQVADMEAIMAIAHRHNLVVIEDCAHAHGTRWDGQGAGTFGQFGSFSLQSSKILSAGEGGILLCKTQELADRATSIADCGRLPQPETETDGGPTGQYLHQFLQRGGQEPAFSLGTNYRMGEFQAALGCVALTRFPTQMAERAAMADYLESRLDEVPGVRRLKRDRRHTQRSFYRYIFAIDPAEFGATHQEVCLALHAEGIPCTPGYSALHQNSRFQPALSQLPVPSAFPERFDYRGLHLPVAEQASEQAAIWLEESVFRAGEQGVDDAIAALKKVQENASILRAAKAAFLQMAEGATW
ncbi:MAG: DegT/DnrJ/EryC1/StrS family aminotransferase [Cyanobacteria bacterium J06581_3]